MRNVFSGKLLLLLVFLISLSACEQDGDNGSEIDVEGTWRAPVMVQSCNPSDVCSAFGFQPGLSAVAVMRLQQDGRNLEGSYTYEGVDVEADISGTIGGNQLVLNGQANHLLGRVTVAFTGTVSNNQINATVAHQVNLIDGRSGTVNGTGNFTRE